ncbi:MAG: hypothetical protein K2X87_32365, partial [Gemmataceae bacterium]|nr:hypothetical protein [Gemmataceae bacterium]
PAGLSRGGPAPVLVFQKPAGDDRPQPGAVPEKSADPKAPADDAAPAVQPIDPKLLRLPPRGVIFTMYDDATLRRLIVGVVARELGKAPTEMTPFPPYDPGDPLVPPGTKYVAKTGSYPPMTEYAEPGFVAHRRLHFEEKNSERYGWDLGIVQPFVSAAAFYKDCLLWPNSLASGLEVGFWDTSAGKCLPGTPVPYYLYPPGLTLTGVGTTLGVYTAGSFIANPVGAGNALINRSILR